MDERPAERPEPSGERPEPTTHSGATPDAGIGIDVADLRRHLADVAGGSWSARRRRRATACAPGCDVTGPGCWGRGCPCSCWWWPWSPLSWPCRAAGPTAPWPRSVPVNGRPAPSRSWPRPRRRRPVRPCPRPPRPTSSATARRAPGRPAGARAARRTAGRRHEPRGRCRGGERRRRPGDGRSERVTWPGVTRHGRHGSRAAGHRGRIAAGSGGPGHRSGGGRGRRNVPGGNPGRPAGTGDAAGCGPLVAGPGRWVGRIAGPRIAGPRITRAVERGGRPAPGRAARCSRAGAGGRHRAERPGGRGPAPAGRTSRRRSVPAGPGRLIAPGRGLRHADVPAPRGCDRPRRLGPDVRVRPGRCGGRPGLRNVRGRGRFAGDRPVPGRHGGGALGRERSNDPTIQQSSGRMVERSMAEPAARALPAGNRVGG